MQITEQMADSAVKALVALRDAVVNAVREAGPDGIPESYLHMALLQHNAPPALPKLIVDTLVRGGVFTRHFDRISLATASSRKGPA
jgi:hypothetical protein